MVHSIDTIPHCKTQTNIWACITIRPLYYYVVVTYYCCAQLKVSCHVFVISGVFLGTTVFLRNACAYQTTAASLLYKTTTTSASRASTTTSKVQAVSSHGASVADRTHHKCCQSDRPKYISNQNGLRQASSGRNRGH